MFEKYRFNKIARKIKEVKIQGASNVARAALEAYYLRPNPIARRVLLHLRPTEPMLSHVLELASKGVTREEILKHFSEAQDKINKNVFKLIKDNSRIFTHCHSTNVVRALIYAKKHGKHFEVYNTETRPLYQGRQTARELGEAGIKVTNYVDSAARLGIIKSDAVFLGADALLKNSVINKIGSGMIAEVAFNNKISIYILADSWKYAAKNVKIEERDFHEVWDPNTNLIHVENPAFEPIPIKYIRAIISELGYMGYKTFLNKVRKRKY